MKNQILYNNKMIVVIENGDLNPSDAFIRGFFMRAYCKLTLFKKFFIKDVIHEQ
jgi:hypothetical protein